MMQSQGCPIVVTNLHLLISFNGFEWHFSLPSLHTMARICKKGGFLINSMTKQYADVSSRLTRMIKNEKIPVCRWIQVHRTVYGRVGRGRNLEDHVQKNPRAVHQGKPGPGSCNEGALRTGIYRNVIWKYLHIVLLVFSIGHWIKHLKLHLLTFVNIFKYNMSISQRIKWFLVKGSHRN